MDTLAVRGTRRPSLVRLATPISASHRRCARLQPSCPDCLPVIWVRRPVPRTLRVSASSRDGVDDGDGEESKRVQDTLEQILQLQVGQERLKEKVVEATGTLEAAAEQVKREIELSRQREQERAEESYIEAMEEIDRMSREASEALDANAAFKSTQDDDEVEAWETKMEQDRSAGQFFKKLYVDENRKKKSSPATITKEEMKAKAAEIRKEVNKELRNPFRLVTYGFLTTVLLVAAIDDSLTESPSWGRIALYVAIAAFCGYNGYREVQYLEEQAEDDKPE